MDVKLVKHYSFDECLDEEKLFDKLDELVSNGKIEYQIENQYVFKIEDIELHENDVKEICLFLDSMYVYPYHGYEEDDSTIDDDFDDFEEDSDYTTKKYKNDEEDYDF